MLSRWILFAGLMFGFGVPALRAQDSDEVPPPREDFEVDGDGDSIPDGWFNIRDVTLEPRGGPVGPRFWRFRGEPGHPAKAHRAFGVDGRTTEALIVGLWVRMEDIHTGGRVGEDPGLNLDFLGENLKRPRRGRMTFGSGAPDAQGRSSWRRLAARIPVPPDSREVILALGLMGAGGTLDVDGMTFEPVPRGGQATNDQVPNGDFELGTPDPAYWIVEKGAARVHPGDRSASALEVSRGGARALAGLALPVNRFSRLEVTVRARGNGLRAPAGAGMNLFFLDDAGRTLSDRRSGVDLFRWSGSFDWTTSRASVAVPDGAVRAVLQVEKFDSFGSLRLDNVQAFAGPDPTAGAWVPGHEEEETSRWHPVVAASRIEPGSALDVSSWLKPEANGRTEAKNGHLQVRQNDRTAVPTRFFGVALLPPTAIQDPADAEALAERLARSGINLVRLGGLDAPLGPGRSVIDDGRDDTKVLDPYGLERLDHLIAELKKRGIRIALELQSERRFRKEDDVPGAGRLPAGGGPAAAFDPKVREAARAFAEALLTHVNPETGLALKDDPVLAWVTLAGELSLFDLNENPDVLPTPAETSLKAVSKEIARGAGRRFWQAAEAAQWSKLANDLRALGVKVPIAGGSHWRREPEYSAAQAEPGLDLIDDRIFFPLSPLSSPEKRSILWATDGGPPALAARKQAPGHPYVLGQWCLQTRGLWATPYEGADLMLMAEIGRVAGWDAVIRRGVFLYPREWGSAATGTAGEEDLFDVPESIGGIPQVFALLPHAASLYLRDKTEVTAPGRKPDVRGWDPKTGRLTVDTPFTQGLAGWWGGAGSTRLEDVSVEIETPYAVVMASAADQAPIKDAKRLLVSAVARVQPTGYRWMTSWRNEAADPGRPPLRAEPVRATIELPGPGRWSAFALDNTGRRLGPVALRAAGMSSRLVLDGRQSGFHWELVRE